MVLIIGQWAGAIGAITLYPLARRLLGGSSNGALWATLFYSCLSTFPQYLFNWGRYPFILGLALLPLLLAALIDLTRRLALSDRGWINYGGLTMLLGAGMVLAHYSTAFFTLSFGLLWLIIERRAIPWKNLRTQLIPVGLGLLTFILALVLLILVRFGPEVLASLSSKWMATLAQSREASNELDYAEIIRLQLRGWGLWLWLAAGTGALFAAFYRRRLLVLTAGWFTTQAALTALQAPILGYGLASYGNLLLAAGLPAALLAGGLAVRLSEWLKAAPRRARLLSRIRGLAPAGMACLALAGGLAAVGLLNPATVLLAPQDIPALTWLQENTLTDAVILVNSSRWGTSSVVPSDSGAWVPFSTSRSIVYLTERLTGDELASFIKQQDVDYVYLGRGGGFLVMSDFTSGAFEPVYDQAGVRIFRVNSH